MGVDEVFSGFFFEDFEDFSDTDWKSVNRKTNQKKKKKSKTGT